MEVVTCANVLVVKSNTDVIDIAVVVVVPWKAEESKHFSQGNLKIHYRLTIGEAARAYESVFL